MRTFPHLLLACMAALPPVTWAQATPPTPPQRLERLEEAELPAVTIAPPQQRSTVTETRLPGGRRTDIEVQSGGSRYTVQPADRIGNVQSGDAQSIGNRPARWSILNFDAGRAPAAAPQVQPAPVPPPPTDITPAKK